MAAPAELPASTKTAPKRPATLRAAAEYFPHLPPWSVEKWYRRGRISSWRSPSGRVLVDLDEIEAMIAASHQPPVAS